jgi:Domain of unknown function DUF11
VKCCAKKANRSTMRRAIPAILTGLVLLWSAPAWAGTPLDLYITHAGPVDFTGTGGTLRAASNGSDACSVVGSDSSPLTGVPAGSSVVAAYLYWAGSYSNNFWSTRTTPDPDILFDGQPLTADRMFTEVFNYGGTDYDFFSGFKDVSAQVTAKGNGSYTFSGLEVNEEYPHCGVQAVVAGWSLVVVYSTPGDPNRIVNIYDGFQYYRGGEISLNMMNFLIADNDISGQASHITWEGDSENSGTTGGYSENMLFNGNSLTDLYNPLNNQFNSTINILGSSSEWGVDFDIYDISPYLNAGDTSATAVYRSGLDLVLLTAEIISVSNAPSADLALNMDVADPLLFDQEGEIVITITNQGPSPEAGPIQVTGTIPNGVAYLGISPGWMVDASSAPLYTWTAPGPLTAGVDLILSVYVRPDASAPPSVSFPASVTGVEFDFNLINNGSTLTIPIGTPTGQVVASQYTEVVSDPINGAVNPKAIPGAAVVYTMTVYNQRDEDLDDGSMVLVTPVPPGTSLYVGDIAGAGDGPLLFQDGIPSSGLVYDFRRLTNRRDDLQFSSNGGGRFNYRPTADADGYDPAVTHIRITPDGIFPALDPGGAPNFSIKFQVLVQ